MVSIYRNTIFLLCNISMLFFPFFHLFIRRNCFFMPAHMTGCRRHACHQEKIQNFHDCRSRNTGKPELLGKELFPGGRDDAVVCHLCQRRLRVVGDQNDRSTIFFRALRKNLQTVGGTRVGNDKHHILRPQIKRISRLCFPDCFCHCRNSKLTEFERSVQRHRERVTYRCQLYKPCMLQLL